MKRNKSNKQAPKTIKDLVKVYWIHVLFIFFLVNFVITRTLQLTFFAQSCMTKAMIDSDQRCLYIYADNVYQKGSRNNPHHGNPCGSNVTSILPSSHMANMAHFLDPNYITAFCSAVTPTNTPVPTIAPTSTPQPTAVPTATNTPRPAPSNTPQPTTGANPSATPIPNQPAATNTQIPVKSPTPHPTNAPTSTPIITTPEPSLTPTISSNTSQGNTSSGTGFGKFLANSASLPAISNEANKSEGLGILPAPTKPEQARFWTSIIFWSELLTAVSFIVFIVSIVVSSVRFLFGGKRVQQ